MNTTIDLVAEPDDAVVRVRLTGDVDFYSAGDLRRLTRTIEDLADVREIRVDLDRVAFLTVDGLGALMRLAAVASQRGVRVSVVGAHGQPGKLIQQTGALGLVGDAPHGASLPTTPQGR